MESRFWFDTHRYSTARTAASAAGVLRWRSVSRRARTAPGCAWAGATASAIGATASADMGPDPLRPQCFADVLEGQQPGDRAVGGPYRHRFAALLDDQVH